MGTGVDARRFREVGAKIAGSGFFLHDGLHDARVFVVFLQGFEGVHVDIAIGTVAGAESATDTPILDDDLQAVLAPDRPHRAAHHTERIHALAAGGGDQVIVVTQSLAHQPGDAVMGGGTGLGAGIATRAFGQIEDEQVLGLNESVIKKVIEGDITWHAHQITVGRFAIFRGLFHLFLHRWEKLHHGAHFFKTDPDQFDMIQGRAGSRPHTGGG